MKKGKIAVVLFLSILLVFSGCSTVSLETNSPYPISMTREISAEYNIVSHFKIEEKAFFTLGGLITFKDIDLEYLINNEVTRYEGDGVVNVKIIDEQNATDILINVGLSLGGTLIGYAASGDPNSLFATILPLVLSSRTVVIEGDIIKKVK